MNEVKNNSKFICTNLPESAEKLRQLGFTEISNTDSCVYIFINDGKLVFEDNLKNCIFTNKIYI